MSESESESEAWKERSSEGYSAVKAAMGTREKEREDGLCSAGGSDESRAQK